jgi:hypothetical protein
MFPSRLSLVQIVKKSLVVVCRLRFQLESSGNRIGLVADGFQFIALARKADDVKRRVVGFQKIKSAADVSARANVFKIKNLAF